MEVTSRQIYATEQLLNKSDHSEYAHQRLSEEMPKNERKPAGLYYCTMWAELRFDLLQFSKSHVYEMTLTHESTHE